MGRTKTIESDGVKVALSFQSGSIHYKVQNESKRATSADLQEALRTADVDAKKVNFIVRGVKKALGL